MKQCLVVLILLAGQKPDATVPRLLTQAVQSEHLAAARYEAYAARADADGYLGAAALFRACARAEHIHESRFIRLVHDRDVPLPEPRTPKFDVGSTRENLQEAIGAEQAERDSTYLYAINTANEAGDPDAASLFDVTRDTETEHANLEAEALRNLEKMRASRTYYVCQHCGFTTEVHLSLCPSCRSEKSPAAVH